MPHPGEDGSGTRYRPRVPAPLRILVVSQMWPGPSDPDLGVFVAQVAREHERAGHVVERAVLDSRAGGKGRHIRLAREAVAVARRTRPDVVFAHFLAPAGISGALAAAAVHAPLVVMAHGTDVENARRLGPVRLATRAVVARSAAVVANSRWLADRLVDVVPAAADRLTVADCGVDLERFAPNDPDAARAAVGWDDAGAAGPRFLAIGSLIERKNVVRLADAFARVRDASAPTASLAFLGDGPLRGELEGRPGVRVVGRVAHDEVPRWVAAADVVCQPSLREPFGQAALEALACARSVVATREGGPREFVTPQAGAIVDPLDVDDIARGLRHAASLPSPNPAARSAAEPHDVRRQAATIAEVLASVVGRDA